MTDVLEKVLRIVDAWGEKCRADPNTQYEVGPLLHELRALAEALASPAQESAPAPSVLDEIRASPEYAQAAIEHPAPGAAVAVARPKGFGIACTVTWTELHNALVEDNVDLATGKCGPATRKFIEGVVTDTFAAPPPADLSGVRELVWKWRSKASHYYGIDLLNGVKQCADDLESALSRVCATGETA